MLQKNCITISEIVFTSKLLEFTVGPKSSEQKLCERGMTCSCDSLENHLVIFSHGKNHKVFTSSVSSKFNKLDRYYRSDMIKKSSTNRPADLLNDCTAQRVSAVLASERANPSCKKKQAVKSRWEKCATAWILHRGSFVNNSMDQIWPL